MFTTFFVSSCFLVEASPWRRMRSVTLEAPGRKSGKPYIYIYTYKYDEQQWAQVYQYQYTYSLHQKRATRSQVQSLSAFNKFSHFLLICFILVLWASVWLVTQPICAFCGWCFNNGKFGAYITMTLHKHWRLKPEETRLFFQQIAHIMTKTSGPRFNTNMSPYQYRKSHCGDKTIARSSYLHTRISYTGKMVSLYWTNPQGCSAILAF